MLAPVGYWRRDTGAAWRTKIMPDAWYAELDVGVRFPVRVLHAAGLESCQSCQGGPGHAYDQPTVDLVAGSHDAAGFRALAALVDYGIDVWTVGIVWSVSQGLPTERVWRVVLRRAYPERADERPLFAQGYMGC